MEVETLVCSSVDCRVGDRDHQQWETGRVWRKPWSAVLLTAKGERVLQQWETRRAWRKPWSAVLLTARWERALWSWDWLVMEWYYCVSSTSHTCIQSCTEHVVGHEQKHHHRCTGIAISWLFVYKQHAYSHHNNMMNVMTVQTGLAPVFPNLLLCKSKFNFIRILVWPW